jgi:hypothetical protein
VTARSKGLLVVAALATLTVWPLVHTHLVRRYGVNPWKLGGWGMYAAPAILPSGMEIFGRAGSGPFEQLSAPSPGLLAAGNDVLARHRWLGRLTPTRPLADRVFAERPAWTELRMVVHQPVLDRHSGMIEASEIVYEHRRHAPPAGS